MKVFSSIYTVLREQWLSDRNIFILEAIGVIASIGGALLMAFGSPNPPLMLVFILYTVGSLMIAWISFKRKTYWMLFLMLFYTITNFIGMYNIVY